LCSYIEASASLRVVSASLSQASPENSLTPGRSVVPQGRGAGQRRAQFNLGRAYADGDGMLQDDREAVAWYRKAASQNVAVALNNLGTMYLGGAVSTRTSTSLSNGS
jgi:TPR repeat protein